MNWEDFSLYVNYESIDKSFNRNIKKAWLNNKDSWKKSKSSFNKKDIKKIIIKLINEESNINNYVVVHINFKQKQIIQNSFMKNHREMESIWWWYVAVGLLLL